MRESSWIPPEPLVFAQASALASWALLVLAGQRGVFGPSPIGFAWIHVVVLGWITSTALAFLIHVLPTFTDVPLKFARLARGAPWIFQLGTVAIVVGFAQWMPRLIAAGGAAVVIAVGLALVSFLATGISAMRSSDRPTRAIARALCIVLSILGITVALGFSMSLGLGSGRAFVAQFAGVHGALGTLGWIALLVAGVSMRTYNALLGRSSGRVAHIATGTLVLVGLGVWIVGTLLANADVTTAGGALIALGSIVWFAAILAALRGATVAHRLPREFVAASAFWLCVAIAYGIAGLAGHGVPAALLFAILVGWVGQNVNAHMMHVGVRLLATLVIDDDDETRPIDLLDRRIGVCSLVLYQAAIACALAGLTLSHGLLLEIGGCLGIAATLTMLANMAAAGRAAMAHRASALRAVQL
jgi:hypothetical protein